MGRACGVEPSPQRSPRWDLINRRQRKAEEEDVGGH